ncbi:TPM domain-containing protein [Stenotrophomonas sp. 24(2023)]|uniref:TPM domain-containing protein n=1 Tax=Stenotrophomonas sp. 24(2023) TaxID=3068324 RepID=UPI0027E20C93|nr:TPM domain-containing protein [Stenotrophomonas sp. 24(2023)]WMJ70864.1 TPM domain-containing protein [Stenotrophomonas sp. 24(2023)]
MEIQPASRVCPGPWWPLLLAVLCILLPPLAAAQAASPIPALADPVVDSAGVLSAGTAGQLRQQAYDLQARKGAQLQVLLVDHAGDEGIEAYAQRVFDQWALGRAGIDDGVLMVVAVKDRRVRIQTGYGLEGAIPDAYARRIIDGAVLPRFRQGDIDQGVLDGTALLVTLIEGEPLPPLEAEGRNVLPSDWRRIDTLVLAALLAGAGIGVLFSPTTAQADAQQQAERAQQRHNRRRGRQVAGATTTRHRRWPWWWRPLATVLVIGGALSVVAAWLPGQWVAFVFILGIGVPVATLLGWLWRRVRGLRIGVYAMLATSAVFAGVMLASGQPAPALVLHAVVNLAVGIAVMLVAFLVGACRARWRQSRRSFAVRASVLGLLTAGYALLVLHLSTAAASAEEGRTLALILSVVGSFFLYFAWVLGMSSLQKGYGGGRSGSSGSSGRSSTSSSSSSWSGGGGSSGGGGASGSW